ncbi:phosphorylase [Methylocystis echinoides]|jgi:adenosylhomocysteine nucleosidase|uniref:phosphorylase family protein n=1 Tax=Methylocystis echinoides TaxID=29468 RepID=UPI00341993C9
MTLVESRRREAARVSAPGPILVLTGMKREAACVAGEGVVAICSGANVPRLRTELHRLKERRFSAVVSFGLAGGLDHSLRRGDVVIADAVISGHERHETHGRLSDAIAEGAAARGCRTIPGAVVGVDQPAMDRHAKKRLREQAQAAAVDMESHLAAEFARERRLPFAVVRAISDPAVRGLPPLAARALTPTGDVCKKTVARELIRAPRQIGGLVMAGLDSRAAFVSLGRCGPLLGPLLRLVLADL